MLKTPNIEHLHCSHCGRDNHKIENCYHIAKPKCMICKWIRHEANNCHFKKKMQKPRKDKNTIVTKVTSTKGEAHIVEIGSDEETLMACDAENPTLFDNPFIKDVTDLNVYSASKNRSNVLYFCNVLIISQELLRVCLCIWACLKVLHRSFVSIYYIRQ